MRNFRVESPRCEGDQRPNHRPKPTGLREGTLRVSWFRTALATVGGLSFVALLSACGPPGESSADAAPLNLVFVVIDTLRADHLELYGYSWHDIRRSWNRLAAERNIPVAYRASFLGHREEVNEGSYETEMAIELMRERMGESMVPRSSESSRAVRDLFELPISAKNR